MSLEDGVIGGTLVGLHVLDGKLELLALLVPLVNGHQQQLLVHFAAHDEKVGPEAVQLGTRAVRPILDVQGQFLQVFLPQHPQLQHLLLLLCRDQLPITLLLLYLFYFHLEGWRETKRYIWFVFFHSIKDIFMPPFCSFFCAKEAAIYAPPGYHHFTSPAV